MQHTAPSKNEVRAPLDEALSGELRGLDIVITRAWQILAGFGVIAAIAVWLVMRLPIGLGLAGLSAMGLAWFSVQARMLGGPHTRRVLVAGSVVEGSLPWIFLLVIGETQGAAYALGSYVPPLMFTCLILSATVRLRPKTTIAYGVVGGIAFLAIYFVDLRPHLLPRELEQPLFTPAMQISRAIGFLIGGSVAYLVTQALRRTIGRAERRVRAEDLFGKYRLGPKIGAGGMGVVHLAVYCPEGGFERTVAIKLIHPHLIDDPRFIDSFRREAEISARLVHANVVQVFDFGRVSKNYFLAMEHVEGVTLRAVMKEAEREHAVMPSEVVAHVANELLTGLVFSHSGARDARGRRLRVIHRDLCPQNVLVSSSGDVKITDFGVARALGEADASHTKTVAGHTGYMAPEQARGDPIDEGCDLFAVGVMIWELLAGASLFRRSNEGMSLLALIEGHVPHLVSIRADLDPRWDAVIARAVAPLRADRFESAAEMQAALAFALGAKAPTDALAGWVRRARERALLQEPPSRADEAAPTRVEVDSAPPLA